MNTKFITNVSVKFNPFKRSSNACRFFLAQLPANARTTMKISTTILLRDSQEESMLHIKLKNGKELSLDTEKLKIEDIIQEVERHSRALNRQAELAGER
ncbi:MAG: hypothetical protein Q9195_005868 [Heterodermia aff. obscurata]